VTFEYKREERGREKRRHPRTDTVLFSFVCGGALADCCPGNETLANFLREKNGKPLILVILSRKELNACKNHPPLDNGTFSGVFEPFSSCFKAPPEVKSEEYGYGDGGSHARMRQTIRWESFVMILSFASTSSIYCSFTVNFSTQLF
jgi:hypothetical protein